jgi:hypothetical protein
MRTKLRDDAADGFGFGRGDWEDGAAPAVSPRNYNHGTGADERPAGRSNDPKETTAMVAPVISRPSAAAGPFRERTRVG